MSYNRPKRKTQRTDGQSKMDVKEATNKAREYVSEVFAGEEISQLGLEEVVHDPDAKQWRITFGFARPWDRQNTVAVNMGLKTSRAYKVVSIDDDSGSVIGLVDRLLPKSTACCKPQTHLNNADKGKRNAKPGRWAKICGPWRDWGYAPVSLFKIFLLYPGSGAGAATALLTWSSNFASNENSVITVGCVLGLVVGFGLEGKWWTSRR